VNEKIVIASLVILALIAVVFAITLPTGEGYALIEKISVKPVKINDSHAILEFDIKTRKSGLKNLNISASFIDVKTNLIVDELRKRIPEKTGEIYEIKIIHPLEKDKDYRVIFEIQKDGETLSSRGLNIYALYTLIPKDRELKVKIRDVDFKLIEEQDSRVLVEARYYIEAMENYSLRFHVKAIQFESNVLADEFWVDRYIQKGKTSMISFNLSLPKDYNYLIKLEAWRNEYLLKSWINSLNLSPTKRIPEGYKESEVSFKVSDFIPENIPRITPEKVVGREGKVAPGFEAIFLILAGGFALWRLKK